MPPTAPAPFLRSSWDRAHPENRQRTQVRTEKGNDPTLGAAVGLELSTVRRESRTVKRIRSSLLCGAALALATTLAPAQTELIANDRFADGGASWEIQQSPGMAAALSVGKDTDNEEALRIEVPQAAGDEPGDIRIHKAFGSINADKEYHVTFQAKAGESVKLVAFVYPRNAGARVLWRQEIAVEPDWKEFTFTFKGRDTAEDCVLGFSRLEKAATRYDFKDIVLTEE